MNIGQIFYTPGHADIEEFAAEVERISGVNVERKTIKLGHGRIIPIFVHGKWSEFKLVQLQGKRGHGAKPYTYCDLGTVKDGKTENPVREMAIIEPDNSQIIRSNSNENFEEVILCCRGNNVALRASSDEFGEWIKANAARRGV